ncbi:MAG: hypothetical protein JXR67_09275 [Bacteroidales bacterium]|nr:hypothetical protein [Bacteroidales bacterium]
MYDKKNPECHFSSLEGWHSIPIAIWSPCPVRSRGKGFPVVPVVPYIHERR